jgi:hypothetical protein
VGKRRGEREEGERREGGGVRERRGGWRGETEEGERRGEREVGEWRRGERGGGAEEGEKCGGVEGWSIVIIACTINSPHSRNKQPLPPGALRGRVLAGPDSPAGKLPRRPRPLPPMQMQLREWR